MAAEIKKEIQLEIAHVLFIDIVGYSKLSINEQHAAVEELNRIVRASEQFQRAEAASRLLKISTGDGMALVFYISPEAPAQCAVEISRVLKEHPSLHVRMGIHSGPVSGVVIQPITGSAPSVSQEGVRERTYELLQDYTINMGGWSKRVRRGQRYHGRIFVDHAEIDISGSRILSLRASLSAPKD
jgi:hypothetical protein